MVKRYLTTPATVFLSLASVIGAKSIEKDPKDANKSSDWIPGVSSDFNFVMASLVSGIASVAMMIGGAVPYVPQYRAIKQTQNAEGFSTYVCLALLIANILRITFWFGKPFELPLLAQSFIMIGAMLVMLHLVISVRQRTAAQGTSRKHFRELKANQFWQWTDFQSYVEFLACFSALCGALLYLFGNNETFVETIGFLAVFTEAMLGMPQFYRNFRSRSTAGMSVAMVAMWTSGDLFKTIYFIVRDAPVQFAICGVLQVAVDIAILLQVFFYGSAGASNFHPLPRG
ncbi:PQ-loop repeat-containing protein 1 [Hypsibius exemplaris]|uniref:Solute carrier family 66 member 2 n=1 Tax=Hypsibius exemplaris TaxID=2072580 RepID=A0A1W0WE07_HYPEX|nr:PQ-loop repeat-containing protein 1 [Hypsibius exemplaris]